MYRTFTMFGTAKQSKADGDLTDKGIICAFCIGQSFVIGNKGFLGSCQCIIGIPGSFDLLPTAFCHCTNGCNQIHYMFCCILIRGHNRNCSGCLAIVKGYSKGMNPFRQGIQIFCFECNDGTTFLGSIVLTIHNNTVYLNTGKLAKLTVCANG